MRLLPVVVFAAMAIPTTARAVDWSAQVAAGTDRTLSPDFAGQAFLVFDLRGRGAVGRGDFRLQYNTETIQVGVENVPLGSAPLQFAAAVRAEGALAGVLRYYNRDGRRVGDRGFFASYLYAFASLKWLPGDAHSVELVAGARRWLFGREAGVTNVGLALPGDPWVFEPRLRYSYWHINAPGEEWQAQVLFPRIRGIAAGVELGVDVRSDASAWGTVANAPDDRRNRPGSPILMARQWLRAGAQVSPRVRLQLEESASWGEGEDDLTRVRVGGMSPYVIPVPGIAWPALLCERFVAAQGSVHVRPSLRYRHEFGALVGGGAFNDVRRTGALDSFGALGGVGVFGDLRFWRFQAYARVGWAFPVEALAQPPHLSAMVGLGATLF